MLNSMFATIDKLDGEENGIRAFIRSRNSYIKRSDGKSTLFPNFTCINARLFREQDLDYHDVKFEFVVQDKFQGEVVLQMNESVFDNTDNCWKVYRYENIMGNTYHHVYMLKEIETYVVTNIGYIVSKVNGTHDPNHDPKFEYAKLKTLRKQVNDALTKMINVPGYGLSWGKSNFGLNVGIDNTTAHLQIWTNGKLMDYNTDIKKHRDSTNIIDYRCLPFLKDKDKYGSLYMFITTEASDAQCTYTRTRADQAEENLILYLQDLYPNEDFQYIPCPYKGDIIISEEVDVYGKDHKDRS